MTPHQRVQEIQLVRICDPTHPHYPETGVFTGEVILLLGKRMAKVKLDHCKHGTDACFVSAGQIAHIQPPIEQSKRKGRKK